MGTFADLGSRPARLAASPRLRGAVAVAALLGLAPGCEYVSKTTPPAPAGAEIAIAVAPDPLRVLWVCPPSDINYCYGSMDSTVTVSETAGVGARMDSVDFVVRDSVLGVDLTKLHLGSADIKAKAGTDRLEPLGRLAVRPIIEGYQVPSKQPRPKITIDITVQVTDDKGNVVKQTKRVPVE
jgi:hypothetical protein